MLPVLYVILEYRKDGRNSFDRPRIRPQSLYCMYGLHSCQFKANETHSSLFISTNPVAAYNRACVWKNTDA